MRCKKCGKKIEKKKWTLKDKKYYCQRCFYRVKKKPNETMLWLTNK